MFIRLYLIISQLSYYCIALYLLKLLALFIKQIGRYTVATDINMHFMLFL